MDRTAEVPAERLCDLLAVVAGALDVGGVRQGENRRCALGREKPAHCEHGANPRTQLAQHVVTPRSDELIPSGRRQGAFRWRLGRGALVHR